MVRMTALGLVIARMIVIMMGVISMTVSGVILRSFLMVELHHRGRFCRMRCDL